MLKDKIQKDFINAMKAKDKQKSEALKLLRAAIKQVEIDTKNIADDSVVEKILRSELKKRKDSIQQYSNAGRDDLVAIETYEANLIQGYLPKLMNQDEVIIEVKKILSELDDTVAFGPAMGKVMAVLKGKADGKMVQDILKKLLQK